MWNQFPKNVILKRENGFWEIDMWMNWKAGCFGDDGSCMFYPQIKNRYEIALRKGKIFGIRMYDKAGRGIGRAFGHAEEDAGIIWVFNGTSPLDCNGSSYYRASSSYAEFLRDKFSEFYGVPYTVAKSSLNDERYMQGALRYHSDAYAIVRDGSQEKQCHITADHTEFEPALHGSMFSMLLTCEKCDHMFLPEEMNGAVCIPCVHGYTYLRNNSVEPRIKAILDKEMQDAQAVTPQ